MASTEVSKGFCRVRAPSRLHLGFIDVHGGLGRKFGGVGVAVAEPCLELSVRRADALEVTGEDAERTYAVAERFLRLRRDVRPARVVVHRAIPDHRGFGSGTQLALALAHGLARSSGLRPSSREIIRVMGRGRRSGIGVGTFEAGGAIVDGGKGGSDAPPPLLARFALPDSWRVVLVTDDETVGVHGAAETGAFDVLPRFSSSCAGYLSRVVLMQLLPGAAEADFSAFVAAVTRLQDCIGDYFAAVQGGRYASPRVGRVLEYLRERGAEGVGQSSWGPTGFVFAPDDVGARRLISMVEQGFPGGADVGLSVVRVANTGAAISDSPRA